MNDGLVIGPLSPDDDKAGFSCGVEALDKYLKHQASQDRRRYLANCFVAKAPGASAIAGYFTLSATSVSIADLPAELTNRLPQYDKLPAVLIGRLAVDRRFQGQGLGEALLVDATRRARNSEPAAFAVVVDAKDDHAAAFYRHFGFMSFASRPLSLFLPMSFINRLP